MIDGLLVHLFPFLFIRYLYIFNFSSPEILTDRYRKIPTTGVGSCFIPVYYIMFGILKSVHYHKTVRLDYFTAQPNPGQIVRLVHRYNISHLYCLYHLANRQCSL